MRTLCSVRQTAATPIWSYRRRANNTRIRSRISPHRQERSPATSPGAVHLARQFGENLICMRHRVDAKGPVPLHHCRVIEKAQIKPRVKIVVGIRIGLREQALQQIVKAAGAKWTRARSSGGCRSDWRVSCDCHPALHQGSYSVPTCIRRICPPLSPFGNIDAGNTFGVTNCPPVHSAQRQSVEVLPCD